MQQQIAKRGLWYGVGVFALIAAAAFAVLELGFSTEAAPAGASDWPALTMTYDRSGEFFVIGENPAKVTTQTLELSYTSMDAWTEIVTAAPDMATRWGTFSDVGSYQQVADGQYITYDAVTGETSTETLEEGDRRIAGSAFYPIPIAALKEHVDGSPVKVATASKVCFNGDCTTGAEGWKFTDSDGRVTVYADDARGIPLRWGDLIIKEVRVTGSRALVASE